MKKFSESVLLFCYFKENYVNPMLTCFFIWRLLIAYVNMADVTEV
jgi:hypothetical protein